MMMMMKRGFVLAAAALAAASSAAAAGEEPEEKAFRNEIMIRDDAVRQSYDKPLPHTYLKGYGDAGTELPDDFTWANVNGVSYLTHSLNQHLPQYCGSCWAHGSVSALADRIKIARLGTGDDINLSIQYILNCGDAGSCHGGYHTSTYEFIKKSGFIPFDTCMPYIACSKESTDGFCKHVDTTCNKDNICRTCDTFAGMGGSCVQIDHFPNATVEEYGEYSVYDDGDDDDDKESDGIVHKIQTEIYVRGPVAATINAEPIVDYKGGVFADESHSTGTNHIVSIVGWGTDDDTDELYWIIRNSWGQYWGEMGYMRLVAGKNLLGIESAVAWATPGSFTVHNFPCSEDGKNCNGKDDTTDQKATIATQFYQDPSHDVAAVKRRLKADNEANRRLRNSSSNRARALRA